MAVSSLKGCWCKFSARIREYLDVVDSYYRPGLDLDSADCAGVVSQFRSTSNNIETAASADTHNNKAKHKQQRHNYCKSNHRHQRNHTSAAPLLADSPFRSGQQVTSTNSTSITKYQNVTRPQLPAGFSKKKTSQGQIFFVSPTGEKLWYDPSVPKELIDAPLDLDRLVGKLSSNWETRHTPSGKTYYVNHSKKTTQFTDPRLTAYRDYLHEILKHAKHRTSPSETTVSPPAYQPSATLPTTGHISSGGSTQHQSSIFALPRRTSNNTTTTSNNNSQTQPPPSVPQSMVRNICSQTDSRSERTVFANRHTHHHHHHYYHDHGRLNPTKTGAVTRPDSAAYSITPVCRPNQSLINCSRLQNQYQMNLLSGSHHNLSTSGNQSATLSRLPSTKSTCVTGARGDEILVDLSPCENGQTTSKSRSNQQRRSGSFANLTSLSANISNTDTFEFIHSSNNNPPVDSKVNHKELFDKISILRQELLKQQVIAHPCRIDVNRKRIFEESFRVVSQLQPRDLKKRLLVKFKGEEGLDYGGVAREWFYLLSREILNPAHGLFQYTSDDIYNLQINPDSGIVYREHLSYLNFCGRIIGMAVFHGHFIEGHFTLPFYKMLLRKPISLDDIEFVDPELYRSLCWMLENNITDVIDTTFLVQHNAFGQLQELELKEGGRNATVTEENKHEYVSLYVNYRCRRGIESQMEALQRGFYELVSPSLVENFDEAELELLIGGLSKINVDDWRRHTKLKNCAVDSPLVGWFWDIVRSYGEDKRARLLQFVTGSPRVPIQGFKALQGVNSELRLFTIHLIKNACTDNLPKSHTCFNRIDLPPYETYDKLRDKLTQAIEETMGFAMQ